MTKELTLNTSKLIYLLVIQAGSPFHEPLLKFLLRYPTQTVDLFLRESKEPQPQWYRFFQKIISKEDGKPFREILQAKPDRLIAMASGQVRG